MAGHGSTPAAGQLDHAALPGQHGMHQGMQGMVPGMQMPGMMAGMPTMPGMTGMPGFNPAMMQQFAGQMAMMQQQQNPGGAAGHADFAAQQMQQQQQMFLQMQHMQQQMQHMQHYGGTAATMQAAPQQQLQMQLPVPQQQQQQQQQQLLQQPQQQSQGQMQQLSPLEALQGGSEKAKIFQKNLDTLSEIEKEYYGFIWNHAGHENNVLQGKAAFDFLSKSHVPREVLKRIWDLAASETRSFLGVKEFAVTLKLIAAAQRKQQVSLERLEYNCPTSMDCPEFDGIDSVSVMLAKKAPVNSAEPKGSPRDRPGPAKRDIFDAFGEMIDDLPVHDGPPPPVPLFLPAAIPASSPTAQEAVQPSSASWNTGGPTPALVVGAAAAVSASVPSFGGWSPAAPDAGSPTAPALGDSPTAPVLGGTPMAPALASSSPAAGQVAPTTEPAPVPAASAEGGGSDDEFADFAPPAPVPSQSAWGAFGSAEAGASAPRSPAAVAVPASPPRPAGDGAWSAWEDEKPAVLSAPAAAAPAADKPKPAGDWAAFDEGSVAAPPAVVPAATAVAAPGGGGGGGGEWADFGDSDFASAPAGAVADAAAASGGAGIGDLWSKMSAFDDLMKEDDSLGGAGSAVDLAQAFTANSAAAPEAAKAPQQAPAGVSADLDLFGDAGGSGGSAANAAVRGFGDSPTDDSAPAPTAAGFAAFDDDDDDFGDFSAGGGVAADPALQPGVPLAAPSVGDVPAIAARRDPGTAQADDDGDWAAFSGGDAATAPAPVPAPASEAFGLDFDGPLAGAGAGSLGGASGGDWGAFPSLEEASPGVDASSLGAAAAPPAGSSAPAANDPSEWANFGFGAAPGVPPNAKADEGGFATFATPAAAAPARPQALAVSGSSQGWACADFGAAPVPPAGGAAFKEAAPAPAASATASRASPLFPMGWDAEEPADNGQPEEDGDGIAGELRRLARTLAAHGHLEEAQHCKAHAEAMQQVEGAEAKKKEAIAREDFEEAIRIKKDISNLSAHLVADDAVEAWRRLASGGGGVEGLEAVSDRLRQRCQCLDDAFDRAALAVAIDNFRTVAQACAAGGSGGNALARLPLLLARQRRARQMSRAIEAACTAGLLKFLQVLLVCLSAMTEVLSGCAESLFVLTEPDWSSEERQTATESPEFKELLRGLATLRRLLWRLGLTAELFLPGIIGVATVDSSSSGQLKALKDVHVRATAYLDSAQAAWATVESGLRGLGLGLSAWAPSSCFEAGSGGAGAGAGASQRQRSDPLCTLCLLPAAPPFSLEVDDSAQDGGVSSALWRGGLWHVQCANFWVRHCSKCKLLSDIGVRDPFAEQSAR